MKFITLQKRTGVVYVNVKSISAVEPINVGSGARITFESGDGVNVTNPASEIFDRMATTLKTGPLILDGADARDVEIED